MDPQQSAKNRAVNNALKLLHEAGIPATLRPMYNSNSNFFIDLPGYNHQPEKENANAKEVNKQLSF